MLSAMRTPDQDAFAVRRASRTGWLGRVVMIITWAALGLQLVLSLQKAQADGKPVTAGLMVYFGYFTILTNLCVALALSIPTGGVRTRLQRFFAHPQTLGCMATSTILVGLGYHFLLRQVWNPEGLQWFAYLLLHYVVPVGFCTYWFLVAPKSPLPWWSPLAWGIYPFLYFGHALLRGAFLGIYPYPFIDVTAIGYQSATRNALSLVILFVIMGGILLAVGKAMDRARVRRSECPPSVEPESPH